VSPQRSPERSAARRRAGSVPSWTFAFQSTPVEAKAEGPTRAATDRALQAVEANRAAAVRELHSQLFSSYRNEIQAHRAKRAEEMQARWKEQADAGDARISAALQKFALERGSDLARFAFLAGFPITVPSSWPAPPAGDLWRLRFREEAKRLYVKLQSDEAAFQKLADRTREDLLNLRQSLQGELNAELARLLVEADERAIADARSAFATSIAAEEMLLTEPQTEAVSGVREVLAEIPGWEPPVSPTEQPSDSADLGASRRLAIEIQTWAAQRGYRVVRRKAEGRDATEEFLRWKRTRHPGP
jgi:hypothetical protein